MTKVDAAVAAHNAFTSTDYATLAAEGRARRRLGSMFDNLTDSELEEVRLRAVSLCGRTETRLVMRGRLRVTDRGELVTA